MASYTACQPFLASIVNGNPLSYNANSHLLQHMLCSSHQAWLLACPSMRPTVTKGAKLSRMLSAPNVEFVSAYRDREFDLCARPPT